MVELAGRLQMSDTGYLLLSVPNAMALGAFKALPYAGLELPKFMNKSYDAHITVMRPEEVDAVGGPNKISERGQSFQYQVSGLSEMPSRGGEYSRFWIFNVVSPSLTQLRKSYGLPHPAVPFHITVAARRRNVLYNNSITKLAIAGRFAECQAKRSINAGV